MPTQPLTAPESLELDPVAARAQFFMDLEIAELTKVIPQTRPTEAKLVY
ncbi:MAG: hypothetical protein JWM80_5462 [Cyanobacteria bacterium RYN_339]|nr:hypothetical protein [Cyanobacteria bacterium RYN_339]